jgi:5-methylthioribose kinase
MRELTWDNAAAYLRETGRAPEELEIRVRELSGGVSNVVLRVDLEDRPSFVIKQCRERLRVAMDWRARLDRIWAERAALDVLTTILAPGTVPQVLFEDRPNYLFAMTCAPDDSETWKTHLMNGQADPQIASRLGTILGTIHAEAPRHPHLRGTLADTSLFDELRVDPYYRTIARAHPEIAPRIEALIAAMDVPPNERTLVLGDFSPKNILVHSGGLILLDFECAHAGDPAFDIGFFLSHLVLKAFWADLGETAWSQRAARKGQSNRSPQYISMADAFLEAYGVRTGLGRTSSRGRRGILHLAACVLARVDGKSPVEYLDEPVQAAVRNFARALLEPGAQDWNIVGTLTQETIDLARVR